MPKNAAAIRLDCKHFGSAACGSSHNRPNVPTRMRSTEIRTWSSIWRRCRRRCGCGIGDALRWGGIDHWWSLGGISYRVS